MKYLLGVLISFAAVQVGMAQDSGTLVVKKPIFKEADTSQKSAGLEIRFRELVDTVFPAPPSSQIHWCGQTKGPIPEAARSLGLTRLELGPLLANWTLESYRVEVGWHSTQGGLSIRKLYWSRYDIHIMDGFNLEPAVEWVRFREVMVKNAKGKLVRVKGIQFGYLKNLKE